MTIVLLSEAITVGAGQAGAEVRLVHCLLTFEVFL